MNNPYFNNQMSGIQTVAPNAYPFQDATETYQKRLIGMANQIANQSNPMAQFQPNQMQGMNGYAGGSMPIYNYSVRAVTGYEEAVASQVPFDGTIMVFDDRPHKRIYTKQLNMNDGTALMRTYAEVENPKPQSENVDNSTEYVEKSEFDELKARFDELMAAISTPIKAEAKPKSEKKESK